MLKSLYKIFTVSMVILCILAGIFLRFKFFLSHPGFWSDEFLLVNNILFLPFTEMFYKMEILILPPFFPFFTKLITNIFGVSVYSLRVLALLFSCGSLMLFYPLLNKVFKNKICIFFGLLLFSVNGMLIYYASECKQYSSEVFFCVLLLFLFDKFKTDTKKQILFWIIISFISPFFAFSSLFVLPVFILYRLSEKNISIKNKIPYLYIAFSLLLAFGTLYITTYNNQSDMYHWHDSRYYQFSFYNLKFALTEFFKYLNLYSKFILITFFAGIIISIIRKNKYAIVSSGIIVIALLASFICKYPFDGRLIIYLTPIIIILVSSVLDINFSKFKIANIIIPIMIIGCLYMSNPDILLPKMDGMHSASYYDRNKEQEYIEILLKNINDTPYQYETVFTANTYYLSIKLDNIILNYNKNFNLIKYNYDVEDEPDLLLLINNYSLCKKDYWIFGFGNPDDKYTKNAVEKILKEKKLNYDNIYLAPDYFLFRVKFN